MKRSQRKDKSSISEPGTAALKVASFGGHVLQLAARTKIPLRGTKGVKDATNDPDTIREYWTRNPDANYGIATGASGLLVLDIDGTAGEQSLAELAARLGDLPDTVTTETPGKIDSKTGKHSGPGRHLFFRAPAVEITAKAGIRPGLDVRSGDTYVVGPGSYHPDGGQYRSAKGRKFGEIEIAELPPEWIEVLGDLPEPKQAAQWLSANDSDLDRRAVAYLDAMPASISGQGGHNALFNAVGSLIWGFSLDPATVKDLIVRCFNPRCQPPWSDREIDHKIQDSMNKPMDKPKGFLLGDDPPKMSWNEYHQRQGISDCDPVCCSVSKKTGVISYIPKLINPANVQSQSIRWLWENKIPLEMITVFAGRQGGGKTFWSCYLAAVITNGWKWPDGTESPMGAVLFFYGEDLIDKTMIPRLQAQGADLSKIRILDGFTKMMDGEEVGELELTLKAVDQIRDAIHATEQETGHPVRMVVVDPVSNHWGGIKENDNAQVREVLKPIQRLAAETGAAFLLITHFGKAIKEEAADKVIGSIAITAVARTVWHLYRDKDRKDHRYFVPSKDNILVDPTGVEFVVNREAGGRVEIISCDLEKHADDIEAEQFAQMRDKMQGRGRKPEQTEAALEWLENFLADGEKPAGSENDPAAGTVRCESEIAGHSWASIRRASDRLGVVKRKKLTVWFWALPLPQNQLAQNEELRHSDNFEQVASPGNLSTYESTCSTCSKFNSVGNSGQVDLLSLAEQPSEGGEVSTPSAKKAASTGPKVYDFEEHMSRRKEGQQ